MAYLKVLFLSFWVFFNYFPLSLGIRPVSEESVSDIYIEYRCPPLNAQKTCSCDGDFVLTCDGGDISKLEHLYVTEIIIKNSKSSKISLNLIGPLSKLTLQDNEMLTDIKSILNNTLVEKIDTIKLINNPKLNIQSLLKDIPKSVNHLHMEKSLIGPLNVKFEFNSLKSLILNNNNIQSIATNVFSSLTSVSIIDLSFNNITTLGENSLEFNNNDILDLYLNSNGINSESIIKSGLIGKAGPLKVHLDNNKIEKFPEDFVEFVYREIQIFFDGNPISCQDYEQIKWIMDIDKDIARKYLINVFCMDYNMNLFEIKIFKNQPATTTKPPVTELPKQLNVTIISGVFDKISESYVAICLKNDEIENCLLCGRDPNAKTSNHTYKGPCEIGSNLYPSDTLIVFGASSVKNSTLSPETVMGLAMVTIKDALKKTQPFKLYFDEKQKTYINVRVEIS